MRNYLSVGATPAILMHGMDGERDVLKGILNQDLLINLRTYDTNALVLYANDHYNNFVHLYISLNREIVFLYNYGDEIVNLTLLDDTLMASLKSIQVAIVRGEQETRMHVNQRSVSIDRGTLLLDEYANKPWSNPEKGKSIPLFKVKTYTKLKYKNHLILLQFINIFILDKVILNGIFTWLFEYDFIYFLSHIFLFRIASE